MNRRGLLGFLAATPIGILVPVASVKADPFKPIAIVFDEAQIERMTLNAVGRVYGLCRMVSSCERYGYRWDGQEFVETDEFYKKRLTALIITGNPNNG